jgi:hypothetical protein
MPRTSFLTGLSLVQLLCIWLLLDIDTEQNYSVNIDNPDVEAALNTNYGVGRGSAPERQPRISYTKHSKYEQQPQLYDKMLRLTQLEFHKILNDMQTEFKDYVFSHMGECTFMTFQNMLIITLVWIIHYPSYPVMTEMFGTSEYMISKIINTMIPPLTVYFVRYIPHNLISTVTSVLSTKIRAILDGTIHPRWKPLINQRQYFRCDYERHFTQTQLLVDFQDKIIAAVTNFLGCLHDTTQILATKELIFVFLVCAQISYTLKMI